MGLSHGEPESDSTYEDIFVEYVKRSVLHSLTTIKDCPLSPPLEVREQARHVLGFALELDSTRPIGYDLLLELAPKMEDSGHRDDWLPYLVRGIRHSLDQNEYLITAQLLVYAGIIHQSQGRLDDAQSCLQEAINLATESGDRAIQARGMIRLAFVQRLLNRLDHAATLAQQALALLPSEHREQARAYSVLGIVAYDQKDGPRSIAYFLRALAIAQKQDDPRNLARRLRDLGTYLRQSGDLSGAAQHHAQAITLFDNLGDRVQGAITRLNLSAVHLDREEPAAALKLCRESEAPLYDAHDQLHLAHLAYNRGLAYEGLDQPDAAAHHLELAADRYARLGRHADQAEVLEDLRRLR